MLIRSNMKSTELEEGPREKSGRINLGVDNSVGELECTTRDLENQPLGYCNRKICGCNEGCERLSKELQQLKQENTLLKNTLKEYQLGVSKFLMRLKDTSITDLEGLNNRVEKLLVERSSAWTSSEVLKKELKDPSQDLNTYKLTTGETYELEIKPTHNYYALKNELLSQELNQTKTEFEKYQKNNHLIKTNLTKTLKEANERLKFLESKQQQEVDQSQVLKRYHKFVKRLSS